MTAEDLHAFYRLFPSAVDGENKADMYAIVADVGPERATDVLTAIIDMASDTTT